MKKRNKLFRNIIVCALSAAMVITSGDFYAAKPQHAAAADVIQALDYAIVENVADFRSYIDNDYPASSQDIIETDWSGDTPLYEINLPCPGTLLVAPISPEGYAKGTVYMDLAKTTPTMLLIAKRLSTFFPTSTSALCSLFLVSTTASPFKMANRVLKLLIPLTSLLFVINNLITSTQII